MGKASRLLLIKHQALTETGTRPAFAGNVYMVSESTMNHTFVQLYVITKTFVFIYSAVSALRMLKLFYLIAHSKVMDLKAAY